MASKPDRRPARHRLAGAVALTAIAALTLTACGAGGQSDQGGEELTVWHYYTLDNQLGLIDGYAESFAETHPDVRVNYVYVPMDQLNSKLIAAAGAGTGPDIIVADGFNVGTLASAGALAPLDEYWDDYADKGEFSDGALKLVDGSTYGVQGHVNSLALWYNKDILDEVGIEPPTTMDELDEALADVTEAGYAGITLSGDPTIQGAFQGYSWWTSDGFTFDAPDADALAASFARVRGWVDDGYLSRQVATWDQNVPFSEFLAGGTAFAQNGNWQITAAADTADFEYGVVPLPLSAEGRIYLGGEAEGIGKFSKNPDLAWEFLAETYLSAEGQLQALEAVGSIPTRADAGKDEAISADPILLSFSEAIVKQGAPYPDASLPSADVERILLAAAQAWSSALAGAASPESAAETALATIQPLLEN